jgi:hypothetical protein
VLADQREQLCTVASLPDDVETRAFEQAGQSLAEQDVILGQDHPQWILHRADTLHRRGAVLTASIPEPQLTMITSLGHAGQLRQIDHSEQAFQGGRNFSERLFWTGSK